VPGGKSRKEEVLATVLTVRQAACRQRSHAFGAAQRVVPAGRV